MIYNSERTLNALAVMGDQKPNTELRDVEITLDGALGGSVKVDGCENQYVSRVSLDSVNISIFLSSVFELCRLKSSIVSFS